jgi:hypothetical protein
MMRSAQVTNNLDEKIRLYNMHLDNLTNLTNQRMDMFEGFVLSSPHWSLGTLRSDVFFRLRESTPFKNKMWMALEGPGSRTLACCEQT